MGEALIGRLEAAVSRLEALSGGARGGLPDTTASAQDPAIVAFDDLVASALGRVSAAAGKIGADVAEVTGLVEKAFLVGKNLLVRTNQTQVRLLFVSAFIPISLQMTVKSEILTWEIKYLHIWYICG